MVEHHFIAQSILERFLANCGERVWRFHPQYGNGKPTKRPRRKTFSETDKNFFVLPNGSLSPMPEEKITELDIEWLAFTNGVIEQATRNEEPKFNDRYAMELFQWHTTRSPHFEANLNTEAAIASKVAEFKRLFGEPKNRGALDHFERFGANNVLAELRDREPAARSVDRIFGDKFEPVIFQIVGENVERFILGSNIWTVAGNLDFPMHIMPFSPEFALAIVPKFAPGKLLKIDDHQSEIVEQANRCMASQSSLAIVGVEPDILQALSRLVPNRKTSNRP